MQVQQAIQCSWVCCWREERAASPAQPIESSSSYGYASCLESHGGGGVVCTPTEARRERKRGARRPDLSHACMAGRGASLYLQLCTTQGCAGPDLRSPLRLYGNWRQGAWHNWARALYVDAYNRCLIIQIGFKFCIQCSAWYEHGFFSATALHYTRPCSYLHFSIRE